MMHSEFTIPSIEGPASSPGEAPKAGYHRFTRSATYGFWMALPLIVAYEVLVRWINRGAGGGVRISSEVWIKNIPMDAPVGQWVQTKLLEIGITAEIGMLVVIILVGVGVFLWERKQNIGLKASYGAGVILESAAYAVVVAYLVSFVTYGMVQMGTIGLQEAEVGLFQQIVLSLGAGIYEELLFRVLLTGGLFLVLKLFMPRRGAYLIAAVVGALLFSWMHYTGSLGDEFTLGSFTFRALFGLVLNAIYLVRGFAVAAWTHAIYDIYVVTGALSLLDSALS